MAATPRHINEYVPDANVMNFGPFVAQFAGVCKRCDEPFPQGALVQYDDNDNIVCCGDITTEGLGPSLSPKSPAVMPRGKTASDRCNRCFQVPASNGVCGCI